MIAPSPSDSFPPRKPWEENQECRQSVSSMIQPYSNVAPSYLPNSWASTHRNWIPNYQLALNQSYPINNELDLPSSCGGQIFPSNSSFGTMEFTLRRGLASIGSLMRTLGGVMHMVDATVYATWSSIMAMVSAIEQLKYLKKEHIDRVWSLVMSLLGWTLCKLRIAKSRPVTEELNDRSKFSTGFGPVLKVAMITGAAYLALKSLALFEIKSSTIAVAICPFRSTESTCIDIAIGDELSILKTLKSSEWILVRNRRNGQEGFVPLSYVRVLNSKA